jgi:hypothetical protein
LGDLGSNLGQFSSVINAFYESHTVLHACMCKEMPVIPVNKVVRQKRIIRKNGGPRRKRGTRGR